jgi:RNA polymerase sigma factor (sigma-70 family)
MTTKSAEDTRAIAPRVNQATEDELVAAVPKYHWLLTRVFRRRFIFDQEDRRDLQQHVFLQVIEKLRSEGGLRDPAKLADYMYMTAWHASTEYWQRRHRRRARHVDIYEGHEADEEAFDCLPGAQALPEELADRQIVSIRVRSAMAKLRSRDRQALEYGCCQDAGHRAGACALGLPEKQFNTLLWRAKRRLVPLLAGLQP